MELKTIGFRPDARLRGELVGVKASRSKYARHSESLSEVEIDMRLKEYFADHDVMPVSYTHLTLPTICSV